MIVGLAGTMRSGKDTVADFLVEKHGFVKVSFAAPLKEACKAIFGWTEEHVNGPLKGEEDPFWGFSPRYALQTVGTDLFRRHFAADTWTHAARRRITRLVDAGEDVVISDCRFVDEMDSVKSLGGRVLRITRFSAPASDHASEQDVGRYQQYDGVIENEGSFHALFCAVESQILGAGDG